MKPTPKKPAKRKWSAYAKAEKIADVFRNETINDGMYFALLASIRDELRRAYLAGRKAMKESKP